LTVTGNSVRLPAHLQDGVLNVLVTDSIGQKAVYSVRISEIAAASCPLDAG
jgi:hypothetical protein